MRLDAKYQVELACGEGELAYPYLDVERAVLEASDSRIAVRVPVEVARRDRSGYVPVEAIRYARGHGVAIECLSSVCRVRTPRLREWRRPTSGHHETVTAAIDSMLGAPLPHLPVPFFAIDVALLDAAAEAMGADALLVCLRDAESAIELRPWGGSGAVAALMGLRLGSLAGVTAVLRLRVPSN